MNIIINYGKIKSLEVEGRVLY